MKRISENEDEVDETVTQATAASRDVSSPQKHLRSVIGEAGSEAQEIFEETLFLLVSVTELVPSFVESTTLSFKPFPVTFVRGI
jgi:hypothetical protein